MQWFRVVLQLRGSVAPVVLPRALVFGLFGVLISGFYFAGLPVSWDIFGSIITNVVFNLVLGLLLVFRTNTAYERFWEGRKTWGILVVNTRNLARQIWVGVEAVEPSDREKKVSLMRYLSAFAVATKLRLRQEPINKELEALLDGDRICKLKNVKSPPLEIALWIGNYLQQQHNRNGLTSHQLLGMNQLLDSLVEALTGCERILKTPIPLAYAIYLRRVLIIYCLALPLQGVDEWKWYTGAIVTIISFVLFGIEQIGNEIENPFGYDPNDLPLDEICTSLIDNIEDIILSNRSDLEASSVILENNNDRDRNPSHSMKFTSDPTEVDDEKNH